MIWKIDANSFDPNLNTSTTSTTGYSFIDPPFTSSTPFILLFHFYLYPLKP
jgi:hypothetical protein